MRYNSTIRGINSAIITGIITFSIATHSWIASIISAAIIFFIIKYSKNQTKEKEILQSIITMFSTSFFFNIQAKTENFNILIGIKQLETAAIIALFVTCVVYLIVAYNERNRNTKNNNASLNKEATNTIIKNDNIIQKLNWTTILVLILTIISCCSLIYQIASKTLQI